MVLVRALSAVLLALTLSACVATTPENSPNDPREKQNRAMFATNQWLDRNFVYPTAVAYAAVVPPPARDRVHDVLQNLDTPRIFINDVLQGEVDRAGKSFYRFGINSTLGVAGLWDVASDFGVPGHAEDFGQTLAVWGVPDGSYLMLPAYGPSNPRDAIGIVADFYIDPFAWVRMKQHIWWQAARTYGSYLDLRARNLNTLTGIERGSVDYYASVRSLYRQSRKEAIANGRTDAKDLPDF
ncbi:MAG TPA: VacJ family lipoprotein [Rhizomicrobium sp.]|nr:VacJ family lipoprotein [Rhizomicrobium sp.]